MIHLALFNLDYRSWFKPKGSPAKEQRSSLFSSSIGRSVAGVNVTTSSIETISALNSCVNVLSQDLAKLPTHVYERVGDNKRVAIEHPNYRLLHVSPNPLMSAYSFKQVMMRSVLYRGNAFAQIQRNSFDVPVALYPIHPDDMRVRIEQDGLGLKVVYDQRISGEGYRTLEARDVFHLKGDTEDGVSGISPIRQNALAFGFALATAEYGANFFQNGAHASVAVVVPPAIAGADEDVKKRFFDQFDDRHTGVSNAGKVVYLDQGGDVKPISVTPEAAQYLDSRKYSRTEIAGLYRVPPHKIGDLERATFSNIEHSELAYVRDALQPWAEQFEQEALLKLFNEDERKRYFVKFNFDALLRGDMKTRSESYEIQIRSGLRTLNECRELEDLAPVVGGGENLVMLNMTTYQKMHEQASASPSDDEGRG